MKKSRYTDEQKIAILRQAAGGAQVRELRRKHGITEQTFYRWSTAARSAATDYGTRRARGGAPHLGSCP